MVQRHDGRSDLTSRKLNAASQAGRAARPNFEENAGITGLSLKSRCDSGSMLSMLNFLNDTLPANSLTYLAFRVACLDTIERLTLARQFDPELAEGFGYLTEVPFLKSVPPHVQLDLLSATWQKHLRPEIEPADLVDESVVYAVFETAARLAEYEPAFIRKATQSGPQKLKLPLTGLRGELRSFIFSLPNAGDVLLLSQFEDMAPLESLRTKAQFGLEPTRCEALFELLGRWHMTAGFANRLSGLLSESELSRAESAVKPAPRSICRSATRRSFLNEPMADHIGEDIAGC